MKLGIGSYSLTWSIGVPGYDRPANPLSAIGLLDKAHTNGIRLVQFADNLPLHLLSDGELSDLTALALRRGIEVEVGTRGTNPDRLLRYLEVSRAVNARLLRTIITDADIGNALSDIREVLPQFEQAGISIAVENHGLHTTEQLAALFASLNHPLVGCCLDTVNSFSALETPTQVIAALTPYILNLHIKDFEIKRVDHQMGFTVLGTPAGYGKLDIGNLLSAIRRSGKTPTAILELWTPYVGTVNDTIELENQWLLKSLDYLKNFNFSS